MSQGGPDAMGSVNTHATPEIGCGNLLLLRETTAETRSQEEKDALEKLVARIDCRERKGTAKSGAGQRMILT